MSRLVSLYPAPWRSRYEDEFLAVLESRPPTVLDRLDIVRGAVDARLHPHVRGPERIPDRSGYLPLLGFALFWIAMAIAVTGPVIVDSYGSYRDAAAALPAFVASMLLLSVGLARIVSRLPSEAGLAAVAGVLAISFGPLWALVPWLFPFAILFLLGLFGLAVGARSAGIMSTGSVVVLSLGLVIPFVLMLAALVLPWYALRTAEISPILLIASLTLVWLVVAWTLLRGFEPSPQPAVEVKDRA